MLKVFNVCREPGNLGSAHNVKALRYVTEFLDRSHDIRRVSCAFKINEKLNDSLSMELLGRFGLDSGEIDGILLEDAEGVHQDPRLVID